jgi:hypothetical protein
MVNFSLNLASIVGIALVIGGIGLYAVRSWRPELSRDYDLFFAAVALLCGGILFFYGWRFDPIMQFGQILLGGSAIFFAFENFRLRGVTTTQARRQSPIVDERRPVSDVYQVDAELDQIQPYDNNDVAMTRRRIRGSQDSRPSRSGYYEDDVPKRSSSRSSSKSYSSEYDRPPSPERPPRRRTRPSSPPPPMNGRTEQWEASVETDEMSYPPRRASSTASTRSDAPRSDAPPRRRRPRPPEEPPTNRREFEDDLDSSATDYVDYQPIDPHEVDEDDNSAQFDK